MLRYTLTAGVKIQKIFLLNILTKRSKVINSMVKTSTEIIINFITAGMVDIANLQRRFKKRFTSVA